ncbi:hypothetical protein RND71_011654 [Anisodus tanguticus]|uniref:Uncharacterized protein n=1 Tax=Anisodus tanguticus TaxID=243964 RepID=A0AAE1SE57_9SOLA|nr:hypothetical protein RND71_011654 [Anisodus tanguticus]
MAEFYINLCYTDYYTLVITINEIDLELDESKLGEVLEVPTDGIKIVAEEASDVFKNVITKRRSLLQEKVSSRRSLKQSTNLCFPSLTRCRCQELKGRTTWASIWVPLDQGTCALQSQNLKGYIVTKKHMLTKTTLEECECMPNKGGIGSNSTISTQIEAQEIATAEIQKLKVENALLGVQLEEKAHEPGSHDALEAAKADIEKLRVDNERLRLKVDELRDQMLKTSAPLISERVDRILKALASGP